jgi:hypothetical protein
MALQDTILQEIQAGRLQPHWTTSDLLKNQNLSRSYPNTTTLRTYPSNYSASLPGLNLGEGHNVTDQPVFYRVGRRDRALLFALPEHRTVSQQVKPATPAPSVAEKKRPKSRGRSDKHKQPDNKWSVKSEHVLGFIDWLVEKEGKKGFNFYYKINNKELKASSIEAAAEQYNWPAKSIPQELVDHINNFPQRASNLTETVTLLNMLRRDLRDSLEKSDPLRHLKACWATLYWGGVATKGGNSLFYGLRYVRGLSNVRAGLIAYHRDAHKRDGWFEPTLTTEEKLLGNVEGMSAGITKIHSLLADELVIYDSRVACAMAWLVERYCDQIGLNAVPNELLFYLPPENAGAKIRRDPVAVRPPPPNCNLNTAYPNPGAAHLTEVWTRDMLRVSLILSKVLSQLNKKNPQTYLEYQLGLFMIGYHLDGHRV